MLFIFTLFYIGFQYDKWIQLKREQTKLAETKILLAFKYKDTKDDMNMFINAFITDCMQDYVMYHIVPDTGLSYINKEREEKIRKDLVNIVVNRISDTIKKKILLCYSEAHFNELLAEKIFYVVTIYVADFNSEKQIDHKETKKKAINKLEQEDVENDW